MILGLSKWSFETPHEKCFDCDGILSKKKLKKNSLLYDLNRNRYGNDCQRRY